MVKIYKTTCDRIDEKLSGEAAAIIRSGGLVILPTETVYGIALNSEDKKAVEKLYALKARDKNKPLTIHVADLDDVEKHAVQVLPYAWRLMYKLWPGPLTVVLRDKKKATVGIRMPKCEITREIIRKSAVTVVMPSANKSGNAAPQSLEQAVEELGDGVDLALDCGPTELGKESTVVDLTKQEPKILRQGAVEAGLIERESKQKRVLFVCTGNSCRSVMAHYFFKKLAIKKPYLEIDSAGISSCSGMGASEETLELLKSDNVEAVKHQAKTVDKKILREADLILVMCSHHEARIVSFYPEAQNKIYLLKEFAKINSSNLEIPDPIGQPLNYYREVYNQIKECVVKLNEIL